MHGMRDFASIAWYSATYTKLCCVLRQRVVADEVNDSSSLQELCLWITLCNKYIVAVKPALCKNYPCTKYESSSARHYRVKTGKLPTFVRGSTSIKAAYASCIIWTIWPDVDMTSSSTACHSCSRLAELVPVS